MIFYIYSIFLLQALFFFSYRYTFKLDVLKELVFNTHAILAIGGDLMPIFFFFFFGFWILKLGFLMKQGSIIVCIIKVLARCFVMEVMSVGKEVFIVINTDLHNKG